MSGDYSQKFVGLAYYVNVSEWMLCLRFCSVWFLEPFGSGKAAGYNRDYSGFRNWNLVIPCKGAFKNKFRELNRRALFQWAAAGKIGRNHSDALVWVGKADLDEEWFTPRLFRKVSTTSKASWICCWMTGMKELETQIHICSTYKEPFTFQCSFPGTSAIAELSDIGYGTPWRSVYFCLLPSVFADILSSLGGIQKVNVAFVPALQDLKDRAKPVWLTVSKALCRNRANGSVESMGKWPLHFLSRYVGSNSLEPSSWQWGVRSKKVQYVCPHGKVGKQSQRLGGTYLSKILSDMRPLLSQLVRLQGTLCELNTPHSVYGLHVYLMGANISYSPIDTTGSMG